MWLFFLRSRDAFAFVAQRPNTLKVFVLLTHIFHSILENWGLFQYPKMRLIWRFLASAIFMFNVVRLFCQWTVVSAVLLADHMSNVKAIRQSELFISKLKDSASSYNKTSYRRVKRLRECCVHLSSLFTIMIVSSKASVCFRWYVIVTIAI